jgi:hypothetical protein
VIERASTSCIWFLLGFALAIVVIHMLFDESNNEEEEGEEPRDMSKD